jgi:flavin reductase (DIM6/NTAB) family NADH-FMN oxidoreductase RutF
VYHFAGTDSGIYLRNGAAWDDVSKAGGYNGTVSQRWVFVQYGDYVLATNGVDDVQYFLIGTSTEFDDVVGAPVCRYLTVLNNFVVASGIVGETAKVQWSALDDPLDWAPSVATQSDAQQFFEVGEVTAVTGGQNSGVVIGTSGIGLMEYVGPPFIFTFRVVEPNIGGSVAGSVVSFSNGVFYYGHDGFKFFNGSASQPIGYDKVDIWFRENADFSNLATMSSVFDVQANVVMFGVPSATAGEFDKILAFSPTANRFSYIEKSGQCLVSVLSESVNVDDVEDFVDDIEAFTDDAIFSGGQLSIGIFDTENRLASFSGNGLSGLVESEELQLNSNGLAFLGSVMVVGRLNSALVRVKHRKTQVQEYSETSSVVMQVETGEAHPDIEARFTKVVVESDDFTRIIGVKARFRPAGMF